MAEVPLRCSQTQDQHLRRDSDADRQTRHTQAPAHDKSRPLATVDAKTVATRMAREVDPARKQGNGKLPAMSVTAQNDLDAFADRLIENSRIVRQQDRGPGRAPLQRRR